MDKIKRLLVVVDPTVGRDFVIARAKLIAKANRAEVRFFINNSNTVSEDAYMFASTHVKFFETQRKLFEEQNQGVLDALVEEFTKDCLRASSEFREEHNLAESILKAVDAFKPDLLMKSSHRHSFLERSILTNTDWRLVRKSPAPLLLVKPEAWHSNGSVVAAIDPFHSKAKETNLDHVLISTSEFLETQLTLTAHVFHAYLPLISGLIPDIDETRGFLDKIKDYHKSKLDELLTRHTIASDNVRVTRGDLVPELVDFLNAVDANILVIGALSRNVLERAIIGDTAEKILEDCPCDVLILKS